MGRILATELSAFSQAGGSGFKVLGYKMKKYRMSQIEHRDVVKNWEVLEIGNE